VDSCPAADPLLAGVATAPGDDPAHASLLSGSRYGKPFERRMIAAFSAGTAWFRHLDRPRVGLRGISFESQRPLAGPGHTAGMKTTVMNT
jgi:hypothetical protein